MVHAKTHGKDINDVFCRGGDWYPKSFPFFAWVRKVDVFEWGEGRRERYTLGYRPEATGGDYYHRKDFELIADIDNILTPDLFEI